MPQKKYIVALTEEEREELLKLTKKGKIAALKMNHARILLLTQTFFSWESDGVMPTAGFAYKKSVNH